MPKSSIAIFNPRARSRSTTLSCPARSPHQRAFRHLDLQQTGRQSRLREHRLDLVFQLARRLELKRRNIDREQRYRDAAI